ncbi:MAG: Na-translocating system protein MpsC family protein [Thermotaleaceae bacterium]
MEKSLLKNLKVLYVEDEIEVMEQMQFFLKKRVGRLTTAGNGKEGLEAFKMDRPDMIISDLKMPIMDGIDMAREVRKFSDVPILITTAFSDQEMILKAVDVGIEKYLLKPLDARELAVAMEDIAVKIFRSKGELIEVKNMILSKEEKLNIEENVKNSIAKFVKEKTGKGPRTVKAFLHGKNLEIEIIEAFTKIEKALLKKEKNVSIVKYNREVFYKDYEIEIKSCIQEFFPRELQLDRIDIDMLQDINLLKFTIL